MVRKAEQSDRTKTTLLKAGKKHFGAVGYMAAKLDEIARLAGVTTGAVYHNFGSKEALFKAVHAFVAENVIENARQTSRREITDDPQGMERAVFAVITIVGTFRKPGVRRILLEDGPNVLGRGTSREQFQEKAIDALYAGLQSLNQHSSLSKEPSRLLAGMLLGAIHEGLELLQDPTEQELKEFERIIRSLV